MLKSELFKLYKNVYIRCILAFVVIYTCSGYLFASPDVKNFYLTADIGEILWGNTVDTAFMIMLLGLVAA
ncbi:MAG: hypothetical protein LBL93_05845, partial [Ruminococcus sp.]|nr:hypothetical protein [Ruminococcus sp.]MDR0984506.1 hypothetical protein [Ruminococcus sp.]